VFAYMTIFLPAFIFVPHDSVQERLLRQRWLSLALAVIFSLAYWSMEDVSYGTIGYLAESTLISLASWSWMFALLGIAGRYLTFINPFLKYANEAVLPFYILHQPVLLCVGYFVVRSSIPVLGKYFIILGISFLVIMLIYEFLVRRFNVMRFLFGMKIKDKKTV
jgi:glucan biosynthesis protein C